MSRHRRTPTLRAAAFALAALAALAGAAGRDALAADPFLGEQEIALGDGVQSEFARQGETHEFPFYAVAGTRIDAAARADAGSAVVPSLRLVRPGGAEVATARGGAFRRYVLPYSGWFAFEVTASSGAGAYRLATSARFATSRRASDRVNPSSPAPEPDAGDFALDPGERSFRFDAAAGTRLTAVLTGMPGRRGPRPEIARLLDPEGADIGVAPLTRGSRSSIEDVTLPASGSYVLTWTVTGRRGTVGIRFRFANPDVPNLDRVLGAAEGTPASRIDAGTPRIAAADGYVGSAACGRCHDEITRDWSRTAHNLGARSWDRAGLTGRALVNDVNRNGKDDFRDGLDLATVPAFAAYGANAPKLSFTAGTEFPCRMTIGAVTYEVARTMGGNGLWQQRYLLRAGNQLVPSPVEYDEASGAYAAWEPETWYDGANAPLHTAASQVPKSRSFEARCSGCHNTGATLAFDVATGEFRTGYVEFDIGCEQCHGPGEEHVRSRGDVTKILNPRRLAESPTFDVAKANAVCARCHTRGEAVDAVPGSSVKPEFGFTAAGGVAQAGDDPDDFLVPTTSSGDFWGRKTNPYPASPGDTFVAAKSSQMQGIEHAAGPHGPDGPDGLACFDCHDPHARKSRSQVRSRRDIPVPAVGAKTPQTFVPAAVRADDGSLCLSCHAASEGPFAAVTREDVAQMGSGTIPQRVADAVVLHMADRGMSVHVSKYDPLGTGVGSCVECHMPQTGRGARFTADEGGFRRGDLRSHGMRTVTPRASQVHQDAGTGMTNSCSNCHPTGAGDAVGTILADWATDGDADGTFHGDVPRNIQGGVANPGHDGGVPCAQCHTTEGFVRIQVKGETLSPGEIDGILKDSIGREKGIGCDACHGTRADGALDLSTRQPLRMAKGQLCGSCHNGQTVVFADFRDRGEMIRHPQREMLDGTAGAESPGAGAYANSGHTGGGLFEDQCVVCHYDPERAGASHRFAPQAATCTVCHTGLTVFNRSTAGKDWDGDGSAAEGIQGEISGLLDRVKGALLLNPQITFSASSNFEYGGASDHKLTGASEAEKRAAFNWYSVTFDGSRGVHNSARAIQLLQRSYRELTGVDVPGAAIR